MSAAAPGDGGRVAPRSIFYGGRSRRCVFATPTEHSGGPTIDTGPDGRSPGTLAKLRCAGDWVNPNPNPNPNPNLYPNLYPNPS